MALDVAGAGRALAGQHAGQHALADAIAPHQAGGGGVEVGGQIGKQHPAIGQGAGHAVEREGECGHATSRDAVGSLHARGGKDTGRQTDGGASLAHAGIPHYTGDWLSRGQYRFCARHGGEPALFRGSRR
ncbi:hypothetical protein D3C72_2049880 [compost metagenome]